MGTGRDDFTQETKRNAAGRVGYRCSFPDCHNATIGASMERADKIAVTGVAAHICAAAEGGPRYNKDMTAEERRSIENCIWMCQTHSKLIDSDEKTYTVEILRQWKADAEKAASKALANGDFFAEYYKGHGDNLDVLERMFDDMVMEGQFDLLKTILEQYTTILSEHYEEFILRYKIIYDVYCDRSKLSNHTDAYCKSICKSGADSLAKLFLSFHLNKELSKIIELCSSEPLRQYAALAIKNELISLFLVPVGNTEPVEVPAELSEMVSKYITNHIVQSKMLGVVDVTGAEYVVFADEFYYRAVKAAYELACAAIYGKGEFEGIASSPEFLFIKDNINKIKILDVSLQEYIWGQFLAFLSEEPKEFELYYEQCPLVLQSAPSIERTRYICQINCDVGAIDNDALLEYVSKSGEDIILCMYLSSIEKKAAIDFLDEHSYLLKKNSIYLNLKLDLWSDIQPGEALAFLEKYKEMYKEDFTFRLLRAKYAESVQTLEIELEWLKARRYKMRPHDGMEYIRLLRRHMCWDELIELSQNKLPNEYAYAIAGYLSENEDCKYVNASYELYHSLVDIGWKHQGLHFNLGIVQRKLGDFERAKASFQNEYDLYNDISALHSLIQLRYELNEYETDSYYDRLKECIDASSQNMVAAICLKRRNYSDARKFFLRSLLLRDIDNPSLIGIYQAVSHLPEKDVDEIGGNVFCIIKNDTAEHCIAIHEADVMEGILSPNAFAGYLHYSEQDVSISSLLFATRGEVVVWNGDEYTVAKIMSANGAIKQFFFSTLSSQKGVTTIRSSDGEDFVKEIYSILQKSSEDLNKHIDRYNQLALRSPLSVFAAAMGKGVLKTCEFLAFENKERIRSNSVVADATETNSTFVLSYDAIVYLTHLGVEGDLLNDMNLMCSLHVKNQLINDINEELSDLTDGNQKGTMFVEGGQLALLEYTAKIKRDRYSFLVRLNNFANLLHTTNDTPAFSSQNSELKGKVESLFLNHKAYCETTSLALTRSISNAVLVTDDQFLFAMANAENIPNIGLTGLLSKSSLRWDRLLSASKKLKDMNFSNYLPIHLYKRIVDQMIDGDSDCDKASAEIQTWILSDTDGDASHYHEDIVIALFREVVEHNLEYLNPSNYLMNIVLNILEKRNPGFIKRCITDAFESLKDID